jgi:spermidine/putrescine transport system ATP-binding protein
MMTKPLIQLQHIQKSFGQLSILKGISFDVLPGEFLTLLGPSGCGKTTLLKIISGFESASSGEIHMDGKNITRLPPQQRNVHTIFQNYALFPHMNVAENVAFSLSCQGVNEEEIKKRVNQALKIVQLDNFHKRNIQQLSGGQQQRVAIARAIINKPKILLLDEPLSSLDYRLRKNMQLELKNLQKELNMTFIFVTHDQEEALSMSDRIIIFNQGQIEQIGTPFEIYENPKNLYVAKFIGETNIFNITVHELTSELMYTKIAGKSLACKRPPNVCCGDPMHLIVRPEDIKVQYIQKNQDISDKIIGEIVDITYKGSTVDLIIRLSSGQLVASTSFFDEEHAMLEYKLNDQVYIEWPTGWEVLLNYEH